MKYTTSITLCLMAVTAVSASAVPSPSALPQTGDPIPTISPSLNEVQGDHNLTQNAAAIIAIGSAGSSGGRKSGSVGLASSLDMSLVYTIVVGGLGLGLALAA